MYRLPVILLLLGFSISCATSDVTAPSPLGLTAPSAASTPSSRPLPTDAGRSADNPALSTSTAPEDLSMAAAPPYDGNYRGNWNGKIGKEAWNRPLAFQVRGTVITVTNPLRLRGKVSSGGLVSMINVADPAIPTLKCTVKGSLKNNKGKRSGLGTWSCADTKIKALKGIGKWSAEVR